MFMISHSDNWVVGFCQVKIQQHKWISYIICCHPEFPSSVPKR